MAKKHAGHILLDHLDGDIKDDEDEVDEDCGNIDLEQNFSSTAQGAPIPALNNCIVFNLSVIGTPSKM